MNKNTIIAASVGAVVALAIVYTMSSAVFGLTAAQTDTTTVAATSQSPTSTYRTTSAPSQAASTSIAAAPVVVPSASNTVIRAGQTVGVKIGTQVSSRDAKVGDPVEAVTTEDLIINGHVVIPSGTRVTGTVSEVKSASTTKAAAVLRVNFSRIGAYQTQLALTSPDLAARARLANHAVDAAIVTGGAVAGGVIGNQTSHDRGTEIGAVAGAVIGGVTAANIGANVQLKLGEAGKLRFEKDLVIN